MNVSQFSIILKDIYKQLNHRNYSKGKGLKFDLCHVNESIISYNKVFISVNTPEDVLEILRHFKIADNLKEIDIYNIVKDKEVNAFEEIYLVLEIQ